MTSERMEKIEKLVKKLIGKVHITGIKGQKVHSLIRNIFVTLEIKYAEQSEVKIKKAYEDLQASLSEHMLSKVEKDEEEIMKRVAKEFGKIYAIMHSCSIFIKIDLLDLEKLENILETKGVAKDSEVRKKVKKMAADWHSELRNMEQLANEVLAESRDQGTVFNAVFEKLHKTDSIMARIKEKSLWKDTLKLKKRIEKNIAKLGKAATKEELQKILDSILASEDKITRDFKVLSQFMYSEWGTVIKDFDNTVKIIMEAAKVHEVPAADSKEFEEAKRLIMGHLVEQYIHGLKIEVRQLEGELKTVEKKS